MPKKEKDNEPFEYGRNSVERFLADAITDLRQGNTTYVYKEYILEKLKGIFNDLDIRRNDFYWSVKNKEVSK